MQALKTLTPAGLWIIQMRKHHYGICLLHLTLLGP